MFELLPSSQTGIGFINRVEENDSVNVLDYMNIYTGAGVAAGDINNDGLVDLYFSGNQTSGKLYLNRGNLKFEDITEKAGLVTNRWCTGVSFVDINQDGFLDIYVNVAGSPKFGSTANLLYINNKNGSFTEQAVKYGIADTSLTMNASFFDYDRDGDLDLFLITNPADEMVSGINSLNERKINGESEGTDILYRNNGNETFTDVSREAGILIEGYSLGAAISDVNKDGWPDIYVSNDFLSNDILYINNRNGTFTDETAKCLPHTSFASMGNDVADFNNDALPDIFVLDMLPEDNYRKKMIIPGAGYDKFQLSLQKGYLPQYTRNTLQLNNGNGTFSDIAFMAGVSSTDWSWSALWADYDNDGDKDLMVTNGFYRDLGNLDYIHYQARIKNPMGKQTAKREEKLKAIHALPNIPLNDYFFENQGNMRFTNSSQDWGLATPGFSNGACYADLDNDGDLELVINQFNAEAKLYENRSEQQRKNNYLKLRLKGPAPNIQAIGANVTVYYKDSIQFLEFNPYRGFESSMEPLLHIGLGSNNFVDSIRIEWPGGNTQLVGKTAANQLLTVNYTPGSYLHSMPSDSSILIDATKEAGLRYRHQENEFVDFKLQPLLPHMHSMNGPGIAVGDIDDDGKEDMIVGAAMGSTPAVFLQDAKGQFRRSDNFGIQQADDMGVLIFDADNDKDNDVYVVAGGSEHNAGTDALQDRLYINDGKGNFKPGELPATKGSGSCVVGADYDKDGDIDLFIGGRVNPGKYPEPGRSYLLRNDSRSKDHPVFTDITPSFLQSPGMVTSALWTDFNNDESVDLIITGEFMPLKFFQNNGGEFKDVTAKTGIAGISGWWNNIVGADFDLDGDIDYVAGNLGLNSRHKATEKEPLCIYAKDFDKNGLIDPVMCYYVDGKNFIYPSRDEMIRQVNNMRGRFPTYESYATVTFNESFTEKEIGDAFIVKSTCFESSYFENLGNGKFARKALPIEAQVAPVFGMVTQDLNDDGYADLLVTGNSYATEASTGRYDAMQGLALINDGRGNFKESKSVKGFTHGRDSKGMAIVHAGNTRFAVIANNNDSLQALKLPGNRRSIQPQISDAYAIISLKNNRSYRQEFYLGDNYLSSGSRRIDIGPQVARITIIDIKGNKRNVAIQ